jgi:hypothetical protein
MTARNTGALVKALDDGRLPWPFTLPAGWGTTQLSPGCESYWMSSHLEVEQGVGTNTLATKTPRFVTPWHSVLGFHQILCTHTTKATVLGTAKRVNLRCDCPSQWNSILVHLGRILISLRHLPHNSQCTYWTLSGKTSSFSLCVSHHFTVVTVPVN